MICTFSYLWSYFANIWGVCFIDIVHLNALNDCVLCYWRQITCWCFDLLDKYWCFKLVGNIFWWNCCFELLFIYFVAFMKLLKNIACWSLFLAMTKKGRIYWQICLLGIEFLYCQYFATLCVTLWKSFF